MTKTLVLGGTRSGKSEYAESLLAGRPSVRYVATARPDPEDTDFAARIAGHTERRPATWSTVETDLVEALATPGPALVDDLGGWLADHLDWEAPRGTLDISPLVAATAAFDDRLVVVSSEVGLGVLPATASGRLFADELGILNQQIAAVCDEVVLVVAGTVLHVKGQK